MIASTIEVVRDPEVCAGHPTIAGTRAAIHDIVGTVNLYDGDLERAHAEALPHLALAEIRAVMAWYASHRDEIDTILRRRQEDYERGLADSAAAIR